MLLIISSPFLLFLVCLVWESYYPSQKPKPEDDKKGPESKKNRWNFD